MFKNFLTPYVVQTGSGAHSAYLVDTGVLSLGVKRPGREVNHSPPTNAQIKKTCIYTSTPPNVFMAYCLIS
jgi:hypothetical protein